jgi:predicted HAD superfamily phosphohydrolase YqeG
VGGRRAKSWRATSLADVQVILRALPIPRVTAVVFDVENTIVCPEPTTDELASAIVAATALVATARPGAAVLFVSNGSLVVAGSDAKVAAHLHAGHHQPATLVRSAKKPRTSLDVEWATTVVVGDQLLTDGLLAIVHGATFVEFHLGHPESTVSRLNRVLGTLTVRPILFSRQRRSTVAKQRQ